MCSLRVAMWEGHSFWWLKCKWKFWEVHLDCGWLHDLRCRKRWMEGWSKGIPQRCAAGRSREGWSTVTPDDLWCVSIAICSARMRKGYVLCLRPIGSCSLKVGKSELHSTLLSSFFQGQWSSSRKPLTGKKNGNPRQVKSWSEIILSLSIIPFSRCRQIICQELSVLYTWNWMPTPGNGLGITEERWQKTKNGTDAVSIFGGGIKIYFGKHELESLT